MAATFVLLLAAGLVYYGGLAGRLRLQVVEFAGRAGDEAPLPAGRRQEFAGLFLALRISSG